MIYMLKVTQAGLQLIGAGLRKLAYEDSAPLIAELQGQVNAQEAAAVEAASSGAHSMTISEAPAQPDKPIKTRKKKP